MCFFFFQAEDGIRDLTVTGVQTCALPISPASTVPAGSALRSPFRDCDNCPEMVVIEPGTVRMRLVPPGASVPRDLVAAIARPFAVGRFELTRGEFRAFAEATGFAPPPGCYVRTPA